MYYVSIFIYFIILKSNCLYIDLCFTLSDSEPEEMEVEHTPTNCDNGKINDS